MIAIKQIYLDHSDGQKQFIKHVTKAILNNDTTKIHYLLELENNIKSYFSHESLVELYYPNGKPIKCICIFGEELITDFHYKAGNDDLTKPWIKRAIKHVIKCGKEAADKVY
ncbi:hypothetical protein [Schinkia azotoformans]|uniref:hypothetical protein n=1 Tax=Schinkia azotoformans TaxID=1454 RepID=UPI002DBCB91B|nr:hypothetical protein [Schinkia azotoformans]MEC1789516.1 hypothetical protein [Schinkia azotoformans]MED4419072.1 hypothetical protein [Schinkia azotoformans]